LLGLSPDSGAVCAGQNQEVALRVVIVLMLLTLPAVGRDFGQWEDQPSSVRQWFQKLMQPDNPYQSCCGEADASEADTFEFSHNHHVAIITYGRGIMPDGTRIPGSTAVRPATASSSWASGQVYCHVTPGGA
jgi:hypothetical protein